MDNLVKADKGTRRSRGTKKAIYIGLGLLALFSMIFFLVPEKTRNSARHVVVAPTAVVEPVGRKVNGEARNFPAGSLRESLEDTSSKGRTEWMMAGGTIITVYLPQRSINGLTRSVRDSMAGAAKNKTMPDSIHFRTELIDSIGGRLIAQIPKTQALEWPIWAVEGKRGRKITTGMAGFSSALEASGKLK